jgi:adenine/guanine phosphoribosyltransferase-like PRPP-binding protein
MPNRKEDDPKKEVKGFIFALALSLALNLFLIRKIKENESVLDSSNNRYYDCLEKSVQPKDTSILEDVDSILNKKLQEKQIDV